MVLTNEIALVGNLCQLKNNVIMLGVKYWSIIGKSIVRSTKRNKQRLNVKKESKAKVNIFNSIKAEHGEKLHICID
ncbi:hypothetical protein I592_01804 [Enterococcus gilvus ATCC BAA-350]|uniref:Uncharacterized protein n=1 Tax=Enterococcus gilvus ATCC BAA-350 TaxID=1158614 RepID=R2VES6_9ENTE|nr:hypothetical protein UKC_02163 [Enterococcus gilvus ATCC BAA-350]EOW82485.1 hypothetical protein I592_01804 [Enterococcus gilvus ATCC BAA-350]